MIFQQFKTLLWRNLVLKRRRTFSTVMEIVIPAVIIILIGKIINDDFDDLSISTIQNAGIYNLETNITKFQKTKIEFGFLFPSEFDKQKQQILFDNIKSNQFFKNYTFLEENKNFSVSENYMNDDDIDLSNFNKRDINENMNTEHTNTEENEIQFQMFNNTNDVHELKIKIFKNNEEFEIEKKNYTLILILLFFNLIH